MLCICFCVYMFVWSCCLWLCLPFSFGVSLHYSSIWLQLITPFLPRYHISLSWKQLEVYLFVACTGWSIIPSTVSALSKYLLAFVISLSLVIFCSVAPGCHDHLRTLRELSGDLELCRAVAQSLDILHYKTFALEAMKYKRVYNFLIWQSS